MNSYVYPLTAFPNGLSSARFDAEVRASAIETALDRIDTATTTSTVWFKAELSAGDVTLLDALVATHSGLPLPSDVVQVSLTGPKTSDGKNVFINSSFPGGVFFYLAGAGDSATVRGAGAPFSASVEGADPSDPTPIEFGFLDGVYTAGGSVYWNNGNQGDHISLELVIPATPAPTSTPGTGNCNQVPLGGGAMLLVPAAGNGSHTVDLATAVPVPAFAEETGVATGYWDYSDPWTGKGAITPGAPGASKWNLLNFAPPPVRFINKFQLVGSGSERIEPQIKPKWILPQWKFRAVIHSAGRATGDLDVAWTIRAARVQTS